MSDDQTCPVEIFQHPEELAFILARLAPMQPTNIIEVGSLYGGTLWHWLRCMRGGRAFVADMFVTDKRRAAQLAARALWPGWAAAAGVDLLAVDADSAALLTLAQCAAHLAGPADFCFVDGGHLYHEVRADYLAYREAMRPGGLMAFHDIDIDPERYPQWGGVKPFWRELCAAYPGRTEELIVTPGMWGVGLLWT